MRDERPFKLQLKNSAVKKKKKKRFNGIVGFPGVWTTYTFIWKRSWRYEVSGAQKSLVKSSTIKKPDQNTFVNLGKQIIK